jgi:Membrane MotB of proton-channel complex MotA/MotB
MQPHVAPIQLKPRQRSEDTGLDDWLMTFADTITLLMAFFVIMFVLSDPNPKSEKFVHLAEQLRLEGFTKVEVESDAKQLKEQLQLMLEDSGFDQFASIKETPEFVEMELASTSFFEPTSARLTPILRLWWKATRMIRRLQLFNIPRTGNFQRRVQAMWCVFLLHVVLIRRS